MKNVMIYISDDMSFNNVSNQMNDAEISVKVGIDNSIELGWNKEDIWLFSNFEFEYEGIKSKILQNVAFFNRKPQASKINGIIRLFEEGLIGDDIYWFHDLDVFQICSIDDLMVDIKYEDIALSDYGYDPKWSTGVIYFKKGSRDIFNKIKNTMYKRNIDEEKALRFLTEFDDDVKLRVKKINKTYNFFPRNLVKVYSVSDKPIKTLHFHPLGMNEKGMERDRTFDILKGDNSLNLQLMPDRLINIFHKHGVV